MKKHILMFCFVLAIYPSKAQYAKEQVQLKSIMFQAYESVSPATRQWFATVSSGGDVDSADIKIRLKGKYSLGDLDPVGNLFACMIAYQKYANKEAREDRKMAVHIARLFLASKEEKINIQNESIDQGMREAREKANNAMDAATTSLIMGISSGLLQIGFTPVFKTNKEKETVTNYIKKLELQLAQLKKEKSVK